MKNNTRIFLALMIAAGLLVNCKMQSKEQHNKRRVTAEELISVNRYMVGKDAEAIKEYVEKNNLNMTETNTGLWYHIDKEGKGRLAVMGDKAEIAYSIYLLDGTLCYSSDSLGNKTFKVGQGGVESGLEEGILLLNEGTQATFIMPPHRAYGLVGDDDKIPGRSTLVYRVEVISLEKLK